MSLYRDRSDFAATLEAAAARRGIDADIVEKDYWVTQVLRALTDAFADDFVFKGGTSLSKAYGCIDRFSEDVDILVLRKSRSTRETNDLLKEMAHHCTRALPLTIDQGRTFSGKLNRTEHLTYERQVAGGAGVLDPDVVLEMGCRGADYPEHLQRTISPMLSQALAGSGVDSEEFDDLAVFPVPVLHAGRTLVEKILMLHTKVTTGAWNRAGRHNEPTRIGRHYHDVHQLLAMTEVRDFLADRTEFLATVSDHERVNADFFKIDVPRRPDSGYANSDAFRPDYDGNEELGRYYQRAMDELRLVDDPAPSWDQVMGDIQAAADLL
jgi:hypothetical protein